MKAKSHARSDAPAFRPGWLRFLVSFFAAFLAAGYLAAISHMAFVAHARCAEHGDLVHVEAGARGPAHAAAPARAPSAGEGETASADEHEHCVLGTAKPSEARLAPPACRLLPVTDPPAAAPPVPPAPFARALVPPPPPIALLLLSPKSSPPA